MRRDGAGQRWELIETGSIRVRDLDQLRAGTAPERFHLPESGEVRLYDALSSAPLVWAGTPSDGGTAPALYSGAGFDPQAANTLLRPATREDLRSVIRARDKKAEVEAAQEAARQKQIDDAVAVAVERERTEAQMREREAADQHAREWEQREAAVREQTQREVAAREQSQREVAAREQALQVPPCVSKRNGTRLRVNRRPAHCNSSRLTKPPAQGRQPPKQRRPVGRHCRIGAGSFGDL